MTNVLSICLGVICLIGMMPVGVVMRMESDSFKDNILTNYGWVEGDPFRDGPLSYYGGELLERDKTLKDYGVVGGKWSI